MLNNTNKTQRKENKMKQYALVKIGTNEPNSNSVDPFYFSNVEELIGIYKTLEQLTEDFDENVMFGPICDWEYNNDLKCTFYTSVNYYAVEFDGEEEPDEEYYIDFASGRLDEYIDELDEENKPKGEFKLFKSTEKDPQFTDFKKVFDRRKIYYYHSALEHAIEFYQAHQLFSESIMNNIDNSTDELSASKIDYECCPSDYHFCDFVDVEGKIITEKLEAVKAAQGWD